MHARLATLCLLAWLVPVLAARAESYSYPDLVGRLTDLPQLAQLPPAGETTALASSYDRGSRYDAATDKYIGWDANGDGSGFVRREGDNQVLAEMQGPGCIWRIWSARPQNGHVKIYLDGATAPVVDLPFKNFFDGTAAPFNRPNVVYGADKAAMGFDNFTPIPFRKSCRIVGEKGWGRYYQFTYTQFAPGTVVPTFHMDLAPADTAALDRADKILGHCGENPAPATQTSTDDVPLQVPAGQTVVLKDLAGAGAITALKAKLELPPDAEAARVLLRQLVLSIKWDDDAAPAVWSPLGDFFGYVGGADSFQSLPAGLLPDGTFYSYWYMPYAKKAHLEITNDGPQPVAMIWHISHAPLARPIDGLARFHAKWHRDAFLPTRADRAPDWTLLTTQGRGRYVGTHLHGWNPRGRWWGEGDDKFFVDGEKFPSSFGTGSEDYFGYAWGSAAHFSRPFHNQILNEGNKGHFDDNRWHIPDSVPFQASFEGCIEKYFSNERSTLYAAEVFWYLDAGGRDPYGPVPVADRIGYWVRPVVASVPGVIEGEWIWITPGTDTPHHPAARDMFPLGKGWSNDEDLAWTPAKNGEVIDLTLPAQKPGTYELQAHFTKGPDYGIFQFNLNGTAMGQPVDLYAPAVTVNGVTDLGPVTLPAGKLSLKITLTGRNAASTGNTMGLDYVKLVPRP